MSRVTGGASATAPTGAVANGGEGGVDLSVVVPAYNEEARLPGMLDETLSYLEARRSPFSYEVIVVDDGSRDRTASIAFEYASRRVRVHMMAQNAGKGAAVRAGMLSARGRRMLMADADAATAFDDVERLEAALGDGADVAVGSRAHLRDGGVVEDGGEGKGKGGRVHTGRDGLRSFVSWVFNLVVVYVGGVSGCRDTQCGFKLYSRRAARVAFEGQHLDRWAFDVENLYRVQAAGLKVVEVPVRWSEVPGSKLSVVKATINMMWDMLRMRYHYTVGSWTVSTPE